jgi:hypothetical protein
MELNIFINEVYKGIYDLVPRELEQRVVHEQVEYPGLGACPEKYFNVYIGFNLTICDETFYRESISSIENKSSDA